MRVFVLHGMGRTVASMLILAGRIQRIGHRPDLFGYMVSRETLTGISARFLDHVQEVLAADTEGGGPLPYAIVGHSLGNVVVRLSLPELPAGLSRLVMLAPPNRPPVSARFMESNVIFRRLTREAGCRLLEPEFFAGLPCPDVPTLVVAGTAGPRHLWLPFRGEPNDSVLLVSETRLTGASELEVDGLHTFLMNRRDVSHAVAGFLEAGESSPQG